MIEQRGACVDGRKNYRIGTHRACHPEQTLVRINSCLSIAGITRVAVVTGLDMIGIPVVMVVRPAGRSLSVSQGKGASLAAAKVSGMMEALEHHHAETIDAPLAYANRTELARTRPTVDLERLQQCTARVDLDQQPFLWIAGRVLGGGEVWVPYELVHLDHRLPTPAGSGRFVASSNGLASGNSFTEALCHALFELVERHLTVAFYGLSAAEQAAMRTHPGSVRDELCTRLIAQIQEAGVRIALWDLSGSFGIPCFLCDLLNESYDVFRPLPRARGVGCHSDKAIALARALCEAAQSRLTNIAGSRDDIDTAALRTALSFEAWEEANQQFSLGGEARTYDQVCSWHFETFDEELAWFERTLTAQSCGQIIVVDLSKREFPLHVVRAIVPGLRIADQRSQGS